MSGSRQGDSDEQESMKINLSKAICFCGLYSTHSPDFFSRINVKKLRKWTKKFVTVKGLWRWETQKSRLQRLPSFP
jgi:hypothetical protein